MAAALRESSFVRGAHTNLDFEQLSPRSKQGNPRCVQCGIDFANADKVHRLACGHIGHRNPCLNPLFKSGQLVIRADARLEREIVEGGEDVNRLEIGQVDFSLERACGNRACRQPIELNQENIQRADQLHRELRAVPEDQKFNFILRKANAPGGEAEMDLVREYLLTFSDNERALVKLEADKKKTDAILNCCEKVFKRAIVGFIAVVGAALMAESYFHSR